MRVALKIAYDGTAFHGFARQPDVRTVEGEILFALTKAGLIRPPNASGFRGASRTDAGVSAVGNVIAFDTDAPVERAVGAFNDAARDVWAWAVAVAPPTFDPRGARQRWYRYHLAEPHDVAALREAAKGFLGPHDFAAFSSPGAIRTKRTIDEIAIAQEGDGFLVDIRAPSFLRGMVRRVVAALLAVERGDVDLENLASALRTGKGPDLGTVPAEPLVLMDVDVGLPFEPRVDRACRERVLSRFRQAQVASRFWREAAARVSRISQP